MLSRPGREERHRRFWGRQREAMLTGLGGQLISCCTKGSSDIRWRSGRLCAVEVISVADVDLGTRRDILHEEVEGQPRLKATSRRRS